MELLPLCEPLSTVPAVTVRAGVEVRFQQTVALQQFLLVIEDVHQTLR